MKVLETWKEGESFELGRALGSAASPGQCYALCGDLGCGKTVMAKGFAKGVGVAGDVVSPTFTILHEYNQPVHFCHFDLYRLGSEEELWDIGWDDYISGSCVCLVEWANLMPEAMPSDTVWILLEKELEKGVDYRRISIGTREEIHPEKVKIW